MRHARKKRPFLNPPEVKAGNWQGAILDGCTISFGQAVQDGPPRRSVEFSYIVMPAPFIPPEAQFTWPSRAPAGAPPLRASLVCLGAALLVTASPTMQGRNRKVRRPTQYAGAASRRHPGRSDRFDGA